VIALAATASAVRAQQPPDATDGFVPVENLGTQEQIPAAPLVMGAYAIAWIAVFGYMWSIWRRLARVERELAEVSRRVAAGGARR
jgi:CcmD family protein